MSRAHHRRKGDRIECQLVHLDVPDVEQGGRGLVRRIINLQRLGERDVWD
jgi:hypothetical protein